MSHQKPLPITKDGYRYTCCEDDEPVIRLYKDVLEAPDNNQNKQKSSAQLLSFTKRRVISDTVKLSENDRAPQLKLFDDCTRVVGEKGYSMVRATHGINRGKFYYEVNIDSMPENTAARIGWSQYYSNLQAPLGYDHYGYSWRSRFGTKFHQARGKSFDKGGGFGQGDTLGCMIELPYGNDRNLTEAHHLPDSIKVTGYVVCTKKGVPTMFEEQDKLPSLGSMKTLVGSKVSFYKNGKFIGVAYEDIFAGFYYPSISLYKTCIISVNFGPKFKFPPEQFNNNSKNHIGYRPVMDIAEISIIDNCLTDLLYTIEQGPVLLGNDNQPEDKKEGKKEKE